MGQIATTELFPARLVPLGVLNLLLIETPQRLTTVSNRLGHGKDGCIEVGHFFMLRVRKRKRLSGLGCLLFL
jgi:hypothetical protein